MVNIIQQSTSKKVAMTSNEQNPYYGTNNDGNYTNNPYAQNYSSPAYQPYGTGNNSSPIASNNYNYSAAPYVNMEISTKPNEADTLKHLSDGLAGQARKVFIMKVYIILTIQFMITAAMCFISYFVRPFLEFQVYNQWVMWVCFALLITTQICIFCLPAGRKHPINLILLFVFTLCESYVVSYICSIVAIENGAQVVVVAAVMTLAIVVGLTVYAIFTPTDFTIKWGIVIVILVAMLMLGIFSIFIWSPFLDNLYCCLGVICFGIYLVIDTQMIIGGRRLEISMDDYVVGALILYIDIIQIFLYLLQLLSRR